MQFSQFIQSTVFNHLHEREDKIFSFIILKGLNSSLLSFNRVMSLNLLVQFQLHEKKKFS
jgi:hypothetical protein